MDICLTGGGWQLASGPDIVLSSPARLESQKEALFYSLLAVLPLLALSGFEDAHAQPMESDAPRAHHRTMSESVSLTSTFSIPSVPNQYTRSISESININSSLPSQSSQARNIVESASVYRTGYSINSNPAQRLDEKSSLLKLMSKKTDSMMNTILATPNAKPVVLVPLKSSGQNEVLESSDHDSEPDDDSSLSWQLDSVDYHATIERSSKNATLIHTTTSAILLVSTLGLVVVRTSPGSRILTHRWVLMLFLLKQRDQQKTGSGSASFVVLLVIVVLVLSIATIATSPSSGQEYTGVITKYRIEISEAYHLDSEREILNDIYEETRDLDGLWSEEISEGHYVRVTFEDSLTMVRDITIYPRVISGDPRVEVYEVDGENVIAEFTLIDSNRYNKVLLTNLQGIQDTFDLRVVGGSLEFDHIVDPTAQQVFTSNGSFTVPSGVTRVTVEAWGGGGGGQYSIGGGGGGGAYSRSSIEVTPDTTYPVVVGTGGSGGTTLSSPTNGGDSYFISEATILAKGGVNGAGSRQGGQASAGEGSTKFSGGAGGAGGTGGNLHGGGGGGSAFTDADGNPGASANSGGAGGSGTGNGGNGGNNLIGAGQPGNAPGGGGGGGATLNNGGAGAAGQVVIKWSPILHPEDGLNQIAFNNIRQNTATPTFRVSVTHNQNSNRFQVELNTTPDFGGTSHTQTFSGTFVSDTQYNLLTDGLSPSFNPNNGETYYVRVRASDDAGSTWSQWFPATWTFTKGGSDPPDWFQTTDAQFQTGTLSNTLTTGSGQVTLDAPATSGTILSPEIDFTWVINQKSWKEVTFSANGGNVKVRIYSSGIPIPDTDLPGNSDGFTLNQIPIDISGLDVIEYKKISLHATLTDDEGNPFLEDWTVSWTPITQHHHVFVGQTEDHLITNTVEVVDQPFAVGINPATNRIYVGNFGNNTVSVIDGNTNIVIDTISVGSEPTGIEVNNLTNRIYVTNRLAGTLSVINGHTGTVESTITVGSTPVGVAVNPATNRIYVTNSGSNSISIIDGYTNTVTGTITVGTGPYGIAFNKNTARLYTANSDDSVSVIDTNTNSVISTVLVGNTPQGITVNPFANLIYVSNNGAGTVSVIDGDTNAVVTTITVGASPEGIAANPVTNRIYVGNGGAGTVSVIDGGTNAVMETITVGSGPRWLGVNDVTGRIYVANIDDDNITVIANTYADIFSLADAVAKDVVKMVSDSVSLEDTITFDVSRSIEESLQVQDAITFRVSRSIGESLQVQDDPERTYLASRSVSETVVLTDEISKSVIKQTFTEIAITDQIHTAVSRSLADNLSVTDGVTPSNTRSIQEDLEFTDLVEKMYHAARNLSDDISITDTIVMSVSRPIEDSILTSDMIDVTYLAQRPVSETVAITDNIVTSATRLLPDSITITDLAQRTYIASRTASDVLSFADEIRWQVSRSLGDNLTLDDEIDRAYHASRQGDDEITIDDAITKSINKHTADSVTISDAIFFSISRDLNDELILSDAATPSSGRRQSESISVADTISPNLSASRGLLDTLSVADNVKTTKSAYVSITDELNLQDLTAKINVFERSPTDTLSLGDIISTITLRNPSENLTITENASPSLSGARTTQDDLALTDGISLSVSRNMDDSLSISDSAVWSFTIEIGDTVGVSDSVQRSVSIDIAEMINIFDETFQSSSRSIQDEVLIADRVSTPILVDISDDLTLSDDITTTLAIGISDSLVLLDSIFSPPRLGEQASITDHLSINITKSLTDSLTVLEQVEPPITGNVVSITETLAISDQFTISVQWTKRFDESLTLGYCTPFSCNESINLNENLGLDAEFIPPPSISDAISLTDSITKTIRVSRGLFETVLPADRSDFVVRPASPPTSLPPLNFMVASDRKLVSPLPSVPVPGQFSMPDGNPDLMITHLNLPIAVVDDVVSSTDLPSVIMVLPTYHISLVSSLELPGDNSLVTVRVSEIPAGTQVLIPVNISATPPAANHGDFAWMTVEYTPALDSFDFALIITILDSPPPGAQTPPGITPLYLDIKWVGTDSMGNPLNLSDPNYFTPTGIPTITFALTDSWAATNNVERDSNAVPLVAVNLFDGPWKPVTVTRPTTIVNGEYVYIAHLDHFSTYAVGASVAPTSGGGSGGGGGSRGTSSVPQGFAASLDDSVLITDRPQLTTRALIEEPAGLEHHVILEETLAASDMTRGFSTLTIGENVTVHARLIDVTYGAIYPPTAKAIIEFSLQNRGDVHQEFILSLMYADQNAEAFEASHPVRLDPGESRTELVEVSFGTPGTFNLVMQAISDSGEMLAITSMLIGIQWITVYFYLLLTVTASILAVSAPIALYLIKRNFRQGN